MAFKQGNNPLSRKASPMRMSPFKKQEPSMSMDELQKMAAAQEAESKAQALKLPQIEHPGSDYEMDQDMSYPGGERGRDYDEEGTKDGMSRHTSEHSTEEYMARKDAAIKEAKGVSRKSAFGDVGKNLKTSVRSEGSVVEKATPKSKEQSIADGNKKADEASKSVSDFKSKVDKQAADTKGKKTAKDAGKVDKSGRDGSNRQERQKRRAERKSIRKIKLYHLAKRKWLKKKVDKNKKKTLEA